MSWLSTSPACAALGLPIDGTVVEAHQPGNSSPARRPPGIERDGTRRGDTCSWTAHPPNAARRKVYLVRRTHEEVPVQERRAERNRVDGHGAEPSSRG